DVARLQMRLAAITIVIPTFTDAMGAGYVANSDVPTVNAGWTAFPGYTAGAIQYTGTANGIKAVAGGAGFIRPAVKNGDSVQQVINFTCKSATNANCVTAVLVLDGNNWIGITAFGQSTLTVTRVSVCQAGSVTTLTDFTNFANASSSDLFTMQIRNVAGTYMLELFQNGHLLNVAAGTANISALVDPAGSGFLKDARYPGLGWRGAAQGTWLAAWSSAALA
ncbi:MAG TPA: hypothetical protein PLF40_33550, partial [Kofleriaceae bacterium]|nr:hypothetical protein [Kofleriaceae bacterium]